MIKPVEFEIVMHDKTKEGADSAGSNVDALSAKINEQKQLINSLEQEIQRMQAIMEKGSSVTYTEDIAVIENLKKKIKELQATLVELENQKERGATTPVIPPTMGSQVQGAIKNASALQFSVQQIARELPSIAMGPQMFFLAISNNLPIFTDNLRVAREEYASLLAQGKKGTPVWKQVLGSMLSWQTAMVVGITLLVVYGKEIMNFVTGLFHVKTALEEATEARMKMNEIERESESVAVKTAASLNASLAALKYFNGSRADEIKLIKQLNEKYSSSFGEYDTLAKWYDTLTAKSAKYIEMLFNEQKAQTLISEAVKVDAQIKDIKTKGPESYRPWFFAGGKLDKFVTGNTLNSTSSDPAKDNYGKALKELNEKKQFLLDDAEELNMRADKILRDEFTPEKKKPDGSKSKQELSDRIADASVKAQQKIDAMVIAAMKEGADKRKEEAKTELNDELSRINQEQRDRLQALEEAKKAGLKVTPGQIGTVKTQSDMQRTQATGVYTAKVSLIDEEVAKREREIWDQVNVDFKSGLDQRLYDIDKYYNDLVEKAEGNQELINQINSNRQSAKTVETDKSSLDTLDFEEEIETQRLAIRTNGLRMDEYIEKQRNAIILQYAKKRIAILENMKDEGSVKELALLKNTVSGIEGNKTKSLKGIVDNKAIELLTKNYIKLGDSEDVAKEKAEKYAAGFTQKMQIASEVTGSLRGALGGVNEDLDKALGAVDSIASGFASGGVLGGLVAASGVIMNLFSSSSDKMKQLEEQHSAYMENMNSLIEKQIELLDRLGGTDFSANIVKTSEDIQKQIKSSYDMLLSSFKNDPAKLPKIDNTFKNFSKEMKELGLNSNNWYSMTADQWIKLKEIPGLYARLPENTRKFIDEMSESQDALDEFKASVQDTILGFDFTDITSMIVDSVTDPSIDDALVTLADNVDGTIADIVKNMLTRNLLTKQIQVLMDSLISSMTETDAAGNITGYNLKEDAALAFTKGVTELGAGYEAAYNLLKAQFKAIGIDFDATTDVSQSAQSGTIRNITEETGTKLEGTMSALQNRTAGIDDKMGDISRSITLALTPLNQIAENTVSCKKLDQMAEDLASIKRDGLTVK